MDKEQLEAFWEEHKSRMNTIIGKALVPLAMSPHRLGKEVQRDLVNFAIWVDEQLEKLTT